MREPFLLCDAALVTPPGASAEPSEAQAFWLRLIEWSGDKRLRLGVESRSVVMDRIGEMGWPAIEPPQCPKALAGIAAQRLSALLAVVGPYGIAHDPTASDGEGDFPVLDAAYAGDEDAGLALALDLKLGHCRALVGVASRASSWEGKLEGGVGVMPPPPSELPLVFEPCGPVANEADIRAGACLDGRRVTIVGHMRDAGVVQELTARFAISAEKVRWVECEKGRQPSLEGLKGMRGEKDVLCCLTGHIGHAGSEKALNIASRCGVDALAVQHSSGVGDALRDRFGG